MNSFINGNKKTLRNFSQKRKKKKLLKKRNFSLKKISFFKKLELAEIEYLLNDQPPHTYIISKIKKTIPQYLLSYVREKDNRIIHVQFHKSIDGSWKYSNLTDSIESSIHPLIKKIIHFNEGQTVPVPYNHSSGNK